MESFGMPYVHMVGVLVYLSMTTIPRSLIFDRWIKKANDKICVGEIPDAAYMSMHAAMLEDCRELVNLSCWFFEDYFDVKQDWPKSTYPYGGTSPKARQC
ncbi:hypothetical protein Ahy_A03g012777 [Arachis hypogaea]|uniref:Protein FAR1-RELATED SEQUENCE n=1 Tax=Arachis hypogaea TaxID=3818 RepID=A0A445DUC4_ARAHY|nr:hypothetical protein Ahy_A03g012777 [Arachis hypogaea]